MCRGNNTTVLNVLQGLQGTRTFGVHINFSLIMTAIDDEKIKHYYPKLRAALVDLLKGGYNNYLVSTIRSAKARGAISEHKHTHTL